MYGYGERTAVTQSVGSDRKVKDPESQREETRFQYNKKAIRHEDTGTSVGKWLVDTSDCLKVTLPRCRLDTFI